jgi:hypothetical protein
VVWAERWAVWAGLNKTNHGLHFESTEGHLALIREAGFVAIATRQASGLGSNLLFVARKEGPQSLGAAGGLPARCGMQWPA